VLAGMPGVVRARGPALTRSIYLPLQDTTIQTHTTPTPPPPPPRTARSLPRRNLKAARARAVPRWGLRATTHTPPSQRTRPDSKPPPRRFLIKLKGQELRCGWDENGHSAWILPHEPFDHSQPTRRFGPCLCARNRRLTTPSLPHARALDPIPKPRPDAS